ncbi:ELMO domain-containing protein C-like isoform X2 [Vespa mandarinia]|uniref:ELMO domain-containing protein C-like isoform X2 n=1 Tax=Vespa mandarinia TaxID=7446 RepID=UPI00160FD6DD|nr:ELMO domain-containing protein C-like isoform X2 [Vespa mandarinia]
MRPDVTHVARASFRAIQRERVMLCTTRLLTTTDGYTTTMTMTTTTTTITITTTTTTTTTTTMIVEGEIDAKLPTRILTTINFDDIYETTMNNHTMTTHGGNPWAQKITLGECDYRDIKGNAYTTPHPRPRST